MYFSRNNSSDTLAQWLLVLTSALLVPVAMAQSASTAPTPQPPASATATPEAGTTVLARGSMGVVITVNDVMSELQHAPEASRLAMLAKPESIQQLAKNLLVRRVLAKEAQRDGLADAPLVAATLAIANDRVLSDARLAKLDAQNAPSDAALDAYARGLYKANPEKFERPAQTHASHILLANTGPESLQKVKDLLAKLRAGASFEELAKTNSTDPGSAARGGDLGYFAAGQMVRPFEEAVNKLAKPGDLSEPVESQFGYHIIRLDGRRDKGRAPYEEIRTQLLAQARTEILNESRVTKVLSMSKDFSFDQAAIETLSKSSAH